MSKEKCGCSWCKAGLSPEDAMIKRVDFLVASFALMFARLFDLSSMSIVKQTSDFKDVLTAYVKSEEHDNKPVFKYIVDTCFYTVGLGGPLTPTQIYKKAEELDEMVGDAFRLFRIDININEIPILSGLLTPEIFVEGQFDVDSLPDVLKTIYNKYEQNNIYRSNNSLSKLMENLANGGQFQMFDMDNDQPEQQERKVIH